MSKKPTAVKYYSLGVALQKLGKHVSKGVKSITVDGKKINSEMIPVFKDNKDHFVEVTMG